MGNESLDPADLPLITFFTTPSSTAGGPVATGTTADPNLDAFLGADTHGLVPFVLYSNSSDSNASYFVASK